MITIYLKDIPAGATQWSIFATRQGGQTLPDGAVESRAWPGTDPVVEDPLSAPVNQAAVDAYNPGTFRSFTIQFNTQYEAGQQFEFKNITLDGKYEFSAATGRLTPYEEAAPPKGKSRAWIPAVVITGIFAFTGLIALAKRRMVRHG